MTREELQRLYDQCVSRAFRVYTHTGVYSVRHIEVLQEGSES